MVSGVGVVSGVALGVTFGGGGEVGDGRTFPSTRTCTLPAGSPFTMSRTVYAPGASPVVFQPA